MFFYSQLTRLSDSQTEQRFQQRRVQYVTLAEKQ